MFICGLFWLSGLIWNYDLTFGFQLIDFFDATSAFNAFVFDANDVPCSSTNVTPAFDQLKMMTSNDEEDATRGPYVFAFPQPSSKCAITTIGFSKTFDSTKFKGPSHMSCE
tara:strand:+ start:181 stop:513 length:333 start_codon:yes stop_codon:yes gene_type:complete